MGNPQLDYMNNPTHIKVGEIVILDKEYRNSSKVMVLDFTPKEMYATVCDSEGDEKNGESWQVMTYRLSKIDNG